ncbi:MAG: ATP-binding protein [Deltaproteobacteria bacterium]|nr:ATP-binding protein [Deltaproteobacteria bacterium]
MQAAEKISRLWTGVPGWVYIGIAVILMPIFTILTVENIHRQQENTVRVLVEGGAALIRAFEAGARTGMMGRMMGGFKLQHLLTETARQPDIIYLMVTDANGTIIAHSELNHIGRHYDPGLDFEQIGRNPDVSWRRVRMADGHEVFEVYRRFNPTEPNRHHAAPRTGPRRMLPDPPPEQMGPPLRQFIFVGLDSASILSAQRADAWHTVVMAIILLLICLAGILLLFMTQGYRTTRASLAKIQAFSDTVVENMPIGLIALDDRRRIASFNQAAQSILGFETDRIVGRSAAQVLPERITAELALLATEDDVVEKEIDCRLGDGRQIPLAVSASRLHDAERRFLGFVLLLKDLREVYALRREILRNQRLASVGRLAAGVAHEVRNPLSSIKGFATYFKERYRERPEDQQVAGIMIQEVDRLNRVISQLLDFARPIKVVPKVAAVPQLVADSLKLVEARAQEKGIRIETKIGPGLRTAFLDPDGVKQVLLNLYLNAIDALEAGGSLHVSAAAQDQGRWVVFKVSDTGHGISKENQAQVFDPYYTTKSTGTGLGLAIAHNIVDAHGGRIEVDSAPGAGTTMTVRIPINREELRDESA